MFGMFFVTIRFSHVSFKVILNDNELGFYSVRYAPDYRQCSFFRFAEPLFAARPCLLRQKQRIRFVVIHT